MNLSVVCLLVLSVICVCHAQLITPFQACQMQQMQQLGETSLTFDDPRMEKINAYCHEYLSNLLNTLG